MLLMRQMQHCSKRQMQHCFRHDATKHSIAYHYDDLDGLPCDVRNSTGWKLISKVPRIHSIMTGEWCTMAAQPVCCRWHPRCSVDHSPQAHTLPTDSGYTSSASQNAAPPGWSGIHLPTALDSPCKHHRIQNQKVVK